MTSPLPHLVFWLGHVCLNVDIDPSGSHTCLRSRPDHQLGEARLLVHLSGELEVERFADDHLGSGEHLQIAQHVTADRPALRVRQADVEVSAGVQRTDQGDDLKAAAEVEHLKEQGHQNLDLQPAERPLELTCVIT